MENIDWLRIGVNRTKKIFVKRKKNNYMRKFVSFFGRKTFIGMSNDDRWRFNANGRTCFSNRMKRSYKWSTAMTKRGI